MRGKGKQGKGNRVGLKVLGGGLALAGAFALGGAALAAGSPVVTTGTATVQGKTETVLTTPQGLTLYYFTADTPTSTACVGRCATIWPPLLANASSVSAAVSLPGQLTVVKDANGNQVAYNGHLLYRYYKDTKPGQALGEGILGKWFVATPDLAAAAGFHPQATSQPAPKTVPGATHAQTGVPLPLLTGAGLALMAAGGILLRKGAVRRSPS